MERDNSNANRFWISSGSLNVCMDIWASPAASELREIVADRACVQRGKRDSHSCIKLFHEETRAYVNGKRPKSGSGVKKESEFLRQRSRSIAIPLSLSFSLSFCVLVLRQNGIRSKNAKRLGGWDTHTHAYRRFLRCYYETHTRARAWHK